MGTPRVKITLCEACKVKHCDPPMEGRVIMPLGAMTHSSKWLNCGQCGKRVRFAYIIKEPEDEAQAVVD